MLTAPTPQLSYDGIAPGVASLEQPLTVSIADVTDNGIPLGPAGLAVFGLLAYRQPAVGAPEVWDSAAKQWVPNGAPAVPVQLAYRAGTPQPWQAIVVGAGTGQFAKAVGGYPHYSFRGVFDTGGGASVQSAPSTAVTFASVTDKNLIVIGPADGEKPENATQLRLQLKDAGRNLIGGLVVRRASPGAELTLSNAAGGSVVLLSDGSIELRPAPGKSVTIAGDLHTDRVSYVSVVDGTRKSLG